eukprot:355606-Chlamydomonas_euryale.AAC.3
MAVAVSSWTTVIVQLLQQQFTVYGDAPGWARTPAKFNRVWVTFVQGDVYPLEHTLPPVVAPPFIFLWSLLQHDYFQLFNGYAIPPDLCNIVWTGLHTC